MNQKNIDYLKDGLKYLGFGDKLNPELEKNIQQRFPEFVLKHEAESGTRKMENTLHFKRSEQSGMYFFNRYDATLKDSRDQSRDRSQTFYINRNAGVTAKEALNLLEGRAVYKQMTPAEGEKYNVWLQMDFSQQDERGQYKVKQYHENYGYNLEKALKPLPIKEMNQPEQQKMLLYALQKGNLPLVTIERAGKEVKMFIEANPQYKTINVYDVNLKKVEKESLIQNSSQEKSVSSEITSESRQGTRHDAKKEGVQKASDEAGSTAPAPRKARKKGLSA